MEAEVHHSLGNIFLSNFGVFLDLRAINNEFVTTEAKLLVVQNWVVF